jgi:hypothetical protein
MKSFVLLIVLILFKWILDDIFSVFISDLIILAVFIKVILNIFKIKVNLRMPDLKMPKLNKNVFSRKNIIKVAGVIIILVLLTSGFYLYDLHSSMVEANNIFALRCTTVNPPLIAYKTAFLGFADAIQNPNNYTKKQTIGFYNDYNSGMKKYVVEENKWLSLQNNFINRWDFKLFQPWYIKKAELLQWNMYEGYRNDAQYLIDIADQKIVLKDPFSSNNEVRDRRDKASEEYFSFYKQAIEIKDWRKFIQYVPYPSVCTEKNTTIPNTSGSIDWEGKSATPSSEFVPIDPYNVI